MRSVILNNSDIKLNENCTLPEIVRLAQYNSSLNSADNFLINVDENNVFSYQSSGTMGESSFDFSIDCRHWSIPYERETEDFQWINKNLEARTYPTFRRRELLDRFNIIEIPDYGHQSMSFAYRDFVPHVFIDGCKIWNRYISMIRHYSKKTVYLLIDKKEINLENCKTKLKSENNINIRICFKNNIEDKSNRFFKNSISFILSGDNGKEYSAEITKEVYNELNLSDYDFYLEEEGKSFLTQINPIIFNHLTVENINVDIDKNMNLILDKQTNDYFKQTYFKNYNSNQGSISFNRKDYDRNIKARVNLKLKHNCVLPRNKYGNYEIIVQSKSDYFEAIYRDTPTNGTNDPKIVFTDETLLPTSDYLYYRKDGTLIRKVDTDDGSNKRSFYKFINNKEYKPPFSDSDEIECVPEYNSKRRIQFSISDLSGEITLKNFLYNMKDPNSVYRWNLVNPEIIYYDENDKFSNENKNINYDSFTENGSYLIYDRGEKLFSPITSEGFSKIDNLSYSFTYWTNLPHNYELNLDTVLDGHKLAVSQYKFSLIPIIPNVNERSHIELPLHYIPTSFYLGLDSHLEEQNTQDYLVEILKCIKIYVIMRSFVIEYTGSFYDGATLHFTLPPYILKNLNRDLMNSIESYLFIDVEYSDLMKEMGETNNRDVIIYDMQYLSEEAFVQKMFNYTENEKWDNEYKNELENRNQAFEESKGLYTMNILNYGNRNNPEYNAIIQNTTSPIINVVKDERFNNNVYQLHIISQDTINSEVVKNKTGYALNLEINKEGGNSWEI